jgi:hypothetical protein
VSSNQDIRARRAADCSFCCSPTSAFFRSSVTAHWPSILDHYRLLRLVRARRLASCRTTRVTSRNGSDVSVRLRLSRGHAARSHIRLEFSIRLPDQQGTRCPTGTLIISHHHSAKSREYSQRHSCSRTSARDMIHSCATTRLHPPRTYLHVSCHSPAITAIVCLNPRYRTRSEDHRILQCTRVTQTRQLLLGSRCRESPNPS